MVVDVRSSHIDGSAHDALRAIAVTALRCAEMVAGDVAAVDVNMGCPKLFSTHGGMGSQLLKKPETVRDILTTLRRNLPADLPVTCKIRLLGTPHDAAVKPHHFALKSLNSI